MDAIRLVIQDGDRLRAQVIYDFLGCAGPDTLDNATAQKIDDALGCGRRDWNRLLGAELTAVARIVDPLADELRLFAFVELGQRADHRDRAVPRLGARIALLRHDLDHAVAVFFVVIGNSLDGASDFFGHARSKGLLCQCIVKRFGECATVSQRRIREGPPVRRRRAKLE